MVSRCPYDFLSIGDSVHSDELGEIQSGSWVVALPQDWQLAPCRGQPHGPQRYSTSTTAVEN